MVLDGRHVDGATALLRVPLVQPVHVTETEHRVTHAEAGEVHHRVADVAQLQVEHGSNPAAAMVELPGVPDHHRLLPRAGEWVAGEPSEAELEERVGTDLRAPVAALVDVHADLAC